MTFSHSFHSLLDEVMDFVLQNNGSEILFRGQNCDKPLNSGLFRMNSPLTLSEIKGREEGAYRIFLNEGYPYLQREKDWELLFIMQHHGVKTRLLDWSPSLLTALFFAVQASMTQPVIWLLNANKLNQMTTGSAGLVTLPFRSLHYEDFVERRDPFLNSFAIAPTKNTARQVIQHGMFTVQGDSMLALEDELGGNLIYEQVLKKIYIPVDAIPSVFDFLTINHVDYFTMYPSLDGLSQRINARMNR